MQQWHDEGYFSADLLMKRTHLETEWLPVGELARRLGGDKIFLSPLIAAVVPPGLSRRVDATHQGFPPPVDRPAYNGPCLLPLLPVSSISFSRILFVP
jgi:PERQ amino acid-rich with GYF domain-containing protein